MAVEPERRRGEADDRDTGAPFDNLLKRSGRRVVGLIDDDQLRRLQLVPAAKGVDAGDLDESRRVVRPTGSDEARFKTEPTEFVCGLVDQFPAVCDPPRRNAKLGNERGTHAALAATG